MKDKMIKKPFIIILLLISTLFISCLEVDSTIDMKKDKSGTWTLQYRIMKEASFITPGTELSGYNYFPLNESEIRKRIDSINGLDLISLSTNNSIEYTQYLLVMNFRNTNNIQSFFNDFTEHNLLIINSSQEGSFSLLLNNPFPGEIDQDTFSLMSALYKDKMLKIMLVLPGIVTDSNKGLLSDNPSEASLSLKIMDTLKFTEPFEWIVNYE